MATFVLFIDTPEWELHHDPALGSYHFEGRCTVRVFMFLGRPFAHPVRSHRFTPTAPYRHNNIFERAVPQEEQILRMQPEASAAHGVPEYVPRSQYSETDPSEDWPTYMDSWTPAPPPMRAVSEESVTQPRLARRPSMRPRRGGHAPMIRSTTPAEIRQWIDSTPQYSDPRE